MITIPGGAVQAARAQWAKQWGDGEIDRTGEQMIDDVLAAAAPLIAAQALRQAVGEIAQDSIGISNADGDQQLAEAMDQERVLFGVVRRTLLERADELERGDDR